MKIKYFILGFIGFFLVTLTFLIGLMMYGQKEIKNFEFENIVLNDVPDGVYKGSYTKARWSNQVEITVYEGVITHIEVTKTVLFERPEITAFVIDEVITKQSLDIDIEAGATLTTKAYLIAIENALNGK